MRKRFYHRALSAVANSALKQFDFLPKFADTVQRSRCPARSTTRAARNTPISRIRYICPLSSFASRESNASQLLLCCTRRTRVRESRLNETARQEKRPFSTIFSSFISERRKEVGRLSFLFQTRLMPALCTS